MRRQARRRARRRLTLCRVGELVAESVLTCPECGHQARETMPTDACRHFYRWSPRSRPLRRAIALAGPAADPFAVDQVTEREGLAGCGGYQTVSKSSSCSSACAA